MFRVAILQSRDSVYIYIWHFIYTTKFLPSHFFRFLSLHKFARANRLALSPMSVIRVQSTYAPDVCGNRVAFRTTCNEPLDQRNVFSILARNLTTEILQFFSFLRKVDRATFNTRRRTIYLLIARIFSSFALKNRRSYR